MKTALAEIRTEAAPPTPPGGGRAQIATTDRGSAGYTMLEVLVSLLIVTFLMAGLYSVLFQTQTSFEAQQIAMTLRQEARIVVDTVAIELRMTGFDVGNLPEAITEARASRLAFVADIDGGSAEPPCDATVETAAGGGAERVSYRLEGTDLLRTVDCWNGSSWSRDSSDQRVAHNVTSNQPLFRYFDDDDNELVPGSIGLSAAQRAAVHSVSIDVELQDPTIVPGKPTPSFSVRTRVTLRNID